MTFPESVWPDQTTVLGVQLQPLTLGHVVLLKRLGSPLAPFGSDRRSAPGLGDLLLAVYVCSRSYARAARAVLRTTPWVLRWWFLKARITLLLRPSVSWELEEAIDDFRRYIAQQSAPPPVWITGQDSDGPSDAPTELLLLRQLIQFCRHTESQAMAVPLRFALYHLASHWERLGQVEFKSELPTGDDQEAGAKDKGEPDRADGKDGHPEDEAPGADTPPPPQDGEKPASPDPDNAKDGGEHDASVGPA